MTNPLADPDSRKMAAIFTAFAIVGVIVGIASGSPLYGWTAFATLVTVPALVLVVCMLWDV